jgi:hypothetical protein
VTTLLALTISSAIAPELNTPQIGTVHSVFAAAANVRLRGGLLTLAGPSVGPQPNGVVLVEEVDFRSLDLEQGQAVLCRGDELRCGSTVVALASAEAWSPTLCPRGTLRPVAEATAILRSLLPPRSTHGFGPLLQQLACNGAWALEPPDGPLLARIAHARITRLVQARQLNAALAAAQALIGLGPGLTPSGDDFLLGFGAVLRSRNEHLAELLCAGIADLAQKRTTEVAATFLRHAARGEYSARILRLLDALGDGSPIELLQRELRGALNWGATSGADCVLGMLVGSGVR